MKDKTKGIGKIDLDREQWPLKDDPRNWIEDYPHENGNYLSRCIKCEELFFGHKRRVICKTCQQ